MSLAHRLHRLERIQSDRDAQAVAKVAARLCDLVVGGHLTWDGEKLHATDPTDAGMVGLVAFFDRWAGRRGQGLINRG